MAEREIPIRESTNLRSVVYDDDTQTLTVQFRNGGSYQYHGVSADTAEGFSTADSAGSYLHSYVKNLHEFNKIG